MFQKALDRGVRKAVFQLLEISKIRNMVKEHSIFVNLERKSEDCEKRLSKAEQKLRDTEVLLGIHRGITNLTFKNIDGAAADKPFDVSDGQITFLNEGDEFYGVKVSTPDHEYNFFSPSFPRINTFSGSDRISQGAALIITHLRKGMLDGVWVLLKKEGQ